MIINLNVCYLSWKIGKCFKIYYISFVNLICVEKIGYKWWVIELNIVERIWNNVNNRKKIYNKNKERKFYSKEKEKYL